MKRNNQQAQLAFDFSFNETVAAIDRINEDAAAKTQWMNRQEQKMLTGEMKPLDVAKRVLSTETISSVRSEPFHLRAWKILDRWALNSPAKLKALETEGEVVLLGRLLDQQVIEHTILLEAAEQLQQGVTEHEILRLNGVQTELL
jgi:hypothetical protein